MEKAKTPSKEVIVENLVNNILEVIKRSKGNKSPHDLAYKLSLEKNPEAAKIMVLSWVTDGPLKFLNENVRPYEGVGRGVERIAEGFEQLHIFEQPTGIPEGKAAEFSNAHLLLRSFVLGVNNGIVLGS